MSTTVKVLLGLVVFFVLAIGGTCAGAYFWFDANSERLREQGAVIEKEAHTFAQTTDEDGCLQRALERKDACTGGPIEVTTCRALASIFLEKCLPVARRTDGFCDGVPTESPNGSPVGIMDMVTWSVAACEALGRGGDQECGRMMSRVAVHCSGRNAPADPEPEPDVGSEP